MVIFPICEQGRVHFLLKKPLKKSTNTFPHKGNMGITYLLSLGEGEVAGRTLGFMASRSLLRPETSRGPGPLTPTLRLKPLKP